MQDLKATPFRNSASKATLEREIKPLGILEQAWLPPGAPHSPPAAIGGAGRDSSPLSTGPRTTSAGDQTGKLVNMQLEAVWALAPFLCVPLSEVYAEGPPSLQSFTEKASTLGLAAACQFYLYFPCSIHIHNFLVDMELIYVFSLTWGKRCNCISDLQSLSLVSIRVCLWMVDPFFL